MIQNDFFTNNGNKLIAEFMGYEKYPIEGKSDGYKVILKRGYTPTYSCIGNLQFHLSWDWLMPVVEKIGSIGYIVSIEGHNCRIEGDHILFTSKRYNKMQSTYETVIEFIEWHNKFMYKK
jgi:hypothetical protein